MKDGYGHRIWPGKKEMPFYGWVALAGATLVYLTNTGIFFYSYGVFLPTMCSEYGWSRAVVGSGLSMALLAFGLPGPLVGASVARFGPRANILMGNLLIAFGLAGMSVASKVWQIYLFYGVMVGLGAGFGTYIACTTVINNWFVRRRSVAMALLVSAGGVGGFLFPPISTWLINQVGIQMAWLTLAFVQLICSVLVGGLLLVKNSPEILGQKPDGLQDVIHEMEKGTASSPVEQDCRDWPTREAVLRPTTWLIAIFCGANFMALSTVTAHQVAYLEDIGFSGLTAAISLGVVPGMSIVGRMGFGLLGVRFTVRHLSIVSFVMQVSALLILLTCRSLSLIYIYAVLFGISYGALIVALPTFIGAYYGRTNYAQILGVILPLAIVAQAVGPIMAGAINDALGTYTPAFAIITAFSTLGLICTMLAYPPKPPPQGFVQRPEP
jgi:MFS family permease